jgi:hypothetical protein
MNRQEAVLRALREGLSKTRRQSLAAGRSAPSVEDAKAVDEYVRQKVPDASLEEIDSAFQHDGAVIEMGLKFQREGDSPDITLGEMVSRAAAEGDPEAATFGRSFLGWPY